MKVLGKDFTLYTHTVTASPYRRQYKRIWKICSWTKPCVSKQPSHDRNRELKKRQSFSTRGAFQCANSTLGFGACSPHIVGQCPGPGSASAAERRTAAVQQNQRRRRRGQGQLLLHLHQHVSERSGPRSACGFSHSSGIKGLMMDAGLRVGKHRKGRQGGVPSGRTEPEGARHAVPGAAIFQTRQPNE